MQIVIEIDEKDKQEIDRLLKGKGLAFLDNAQLIKRVVLAVFHGYLLPEGHGRLIDASNLLTFTDYDGEIEKTYVLYDEIEATPTIIEADRSEKR